MGWELVPVASRVANAETVGVTQRNGHVNAVQFGTRFGMIQLVQPGRGSKHIGMRASTDLGFGPADRTISSLAGTREIHLLQLEELFVVRGEAWTEVIARFS
jgi:hypothetical protein